MAKAITSAPNHQSTINPQGRELRLWTSLPFPIRAACPDRATRRAKSVRSSWDIPQSSASWWYPLL